MKSLALLFILVVNMTLAAQYYSGIHKLYYTNSSGEKGVSTYIYNGRKTPYKAIWELENGSRWSVNYHEFDSLGNLTGKYREFSDSITSRLAYIYNEAGELVSETFTRSDGIRGQVEYVQEGGKCMSAKCEGLNGWYFGEIQYHYGKNGVRDSATLLNERNRIGRILYTQNANGQLQTEVWEFLNGFSQTFLYEYIDSDCTPCHSSNVFIPPACTRVVKKENYDYNGQDGGPSWYDYDENNCLIKKTFVRSDGLKTTTVYTYCENGLLKKSVRQSNDGETGTFGYLYNANRQLIRRDFLKSDGTTSLEEYQYDNKGRLVTGSYVQFDGWLTGNLKFFHDRYDRITSADFESENGLDARLTFSYDAYGNLTGIHWLFSDDTTQTYRFIYGLP